MFSGKYFEGVYFINHTPFKNEFIARVSVAWEKAKILGSTSVFCDYERIVQPDGYVLFIVDITFHKTENKKSVLVAKETLKFSLDGGKSIKYKLFY